MSKNEFGEIIKKRAFEIFIETIKLEEYIEKTAEENDFDRDELKEFISEKCFEGMSEAVGQECGEEMKNDFLNGVKEAI